MDKKTHIFIVDHDANFVTKVIKSSTELVKHDIKTYINSGELIHDLKKYPFDNRQIYIVFLSTNLELDSKGKTVDAIDVLKFIRDINRNIEVIIYSESDDMQYVSSIYRNKAYNFILNNENFILRLENNIKGIISQKQYIQKRRKGLFFLRIFVIFLLVVVIILLILNFSHPEIFHH